VLVVLAVARIIGGFVAVFLAALVGVLWPGPGHGRPSFFSELNKKAGHEIVRFGNLSGFVIFVLFALVTPIIFALLRAPLASDGIETRPRFDPFIFRAEAAIVHTDTSAYGLANGSCLLYLGQSDGIIALYDPASRTSWRMPASATAVETGERLDDVERVPGDCPAR
jgi:hypothetical protein